MTMNNRYPKPYDPKGLNEVLATIAESEGDYFEASIQWTQALKYADNDKHLKILENKMKYCSLMAALKEESE